MRIPRTSFVLFIAGLISGCNSYDLHNVSESLEYQNLKLYGYASDPEHKLTFQLPSTVKWQSGPTTKRPNFYTYTWLPKNQDTENWQQLITENHINFKVTKKTTVKGMALLVNLESDRVCHDTNFKFLKEEANDVIYELTANDCGENKKEGNQWTVGRVMKGTDGFYSLRYSIHTGAVTPELQKIAIATIQSASFFSPPNH